jgi:hypothetical protein
MANLLSKITTPDNTQYTLKDGTLTAGTGINISDNNASTGARTITNTGVRAISTGSANGTISVNTNGQSADVTVKGLGTAAYTNSEDYATADHKHDYLPLSGGTLSGNVNRYYGSASTNPMFKLVSNNQDAIFFDIGHGSSATATPSSDYQLKYVGTGSDPNNTLVLTGKNGSTITEILKTNQTGTSATFIGNSATATNFKDDTKVTLTGVVTGEATSKRGWTIPTNIADGQITNAMLEGKIANGKLVNSAVTIAGKSISLGGSLSAANLVTALGLSSAMRYQGSLTELPAATNADTYAAYDAGDVVTISSDGKEYVYNKGENAAGSSWVELGGESAYKKIQQAVPDPGANGTSTSFIKTIEQDTEGVITAQKASLPTASTSTAGIMKVGTGLSASSGTVSVTYGNAANTACQGNDTRLSNARTPTSHAHGNIANGGTMTAEGSIEPGDKLVIVDTSDSNKLTGSTITFVANGTKFLRDDGTWQPVITTHRTYTSFTGKPTANATPGFGQTFTISQISQSTTGQVSGTDRTVTIPALPEASTSTAGIIKIGTSKDDAAAGNHNHDSTYVNVSGDTMTGDLSFTKVTSTEYPANSKAIRWSGDNDAAAIYYRQTGSNAGDLILETSDDSNERIIFRHTKEGVTGKYDGVIVSPYNATITPSLTNKGSIGTSSVKWNAMYATTFNGDLNGNADTATSADTAASATTASKLSNTSAIGGTDHPVYFTNGGVPAKTTYRMAGTNATATTALAITDNLDTGIWYVNGTNSSSLYSQTDGAAYVNKYSDSWIHEIYGDYRTGHIAVRGKNNGTWKSWYKVLDSGNYEDFAIPKSIGTSAGDIIYWSSSGTPARLAKGSNGQVLKINSSGVPAWAADNNDNNYVSQSGSTTANWRKVLLHYKDDAASTTAVTSSTNVVYSAVGVSVQPSTGTIRTNAYNVADHVTLQYNSTDASLDFVFA